MGVITRGGFYVNGKQWRRIFQVPDLALRSCLPRGLPTHKVMSNLNAERIDISAFAAGLVEPLCTLAGGTVSFPTPPPPPSFAKVYPTIRL